MQLRSVALWLPTTISAFNCVLFFLFKTESENKSGMVASNLLDLLFVLYVLGPVSLTICRLISLKFAFAEWVMIVFAITLSLTLMTLSIRYHSLRFVNGLSAFLLLASSTAVIAVILKFIDLSEKNLTK